MFLSFVQFHIVSFVSYRGRFFITDDVIEIEIDADGKKETKLDQILLNGSNITMLVPGGDPSQS